MRERTPEEWAAIKSTPQSVTLTYMQWLSVKSALAMRSEIDRRLPAILEAMHSQTPEPETDVSEQTSRSDSGTS